PVPVTTGRQRRGLETRSLLRGSGCRSAKVIAIHAPDYVNADLLGAGFLTLAEQSAAPEAFRIHLLDHGNRPAIALRLPLRQEPQVRDLRARKERCRTVRARCHARTAPNAGSGVH